MNSKNIAPIATNIPELFDQIFTFPKFTYSVYEKRIIYKLAELAIMHKCNHDFTFEDSKISISETGIVNAQIEIKSLLFSEYSQDHAYIRDAVNSLSSKLLYYREGKAVLVIPYIFRPKAERNDYKIEFEVESKIWDCITILAEKYSRLELSTIAKSSSVHTMRFCDMIVSQKRKFTFSVQQLKEMFCVTDKYKNTANFVIKVIEPAKKEFDSYFPYSFDFKPIKRGRKIIAFEFTTISNC